MTWRIYDEAVEMVQRRFQLFPLVFRWRGQRYEVETVERCWTVVRRGWRGRVQRHFYHVRCSQGDFELYQDIRAGSWHLRRARLGTARAPFQKAVAAAWQ